MTCNIFSGLKACKIPCQWILNTKLQNEAQLGSMAGAAPCRFDWEPLVPAGPALAFHVGCIIGNSLYVHGGIKQRDSSVPSLKLYKMDLSTRIWNEVRASGGPGLSHHACVVQHNRYMLLIGGWNGKQRSSEIFAYDTENQTWMHPQSNGFPEGAGLSSHTATLLQNGNILIIGREGSLRSQRRSGNSFLLSGDIGKGFVYRTHSNAVASRSGHTANIVGSTLYVVGGRRDHLLEMASGFCNHSHKPVEILTNIQKSVTQLLKMSKLPCGRKNHVSFSGPNFLLIHGGETFDGRSREPVGETFVITTNPHQIFYQLPMDRPYNRAGHICCVEGDNIITHGGMGSKYFVYGDTYRFRMLCD